MNHDAAAERPAETGLIPLKDDTRSRGGVTGRRGRLACATHAVEHREIIEAPANIAIPIRAPADRA
jgi:hypothetical protein